MSYFTPDPNNKPFCRRGDKCLATTKGPAEFVAKVLIKPLKSTSNIFSNKYII